MRKTQNEAAQDSNNEQLPKTVEYSRIEIFCFQLLDFCDSKSYKKALWEMLESYICNADTDNSISKDRYHIISSYRNLSKFLKKAQKEVDRLKEMGQMIPTHL